MLMYSSFQKRYPDEAIYRSSGVLFFSCKRIRSICEDVLCEKDVLSNFTKFTEKQLRQSLFLNKVPGNKVAQSLGSVPIKRLM